MYDQLKRSSAVVDALDGQCLIVDHNSLVYSDALETKLTETTRSCHSLAAWAIDLVCQTLVTSVSVVSGLVHGLVALQLMIMCSRANACMYAEAD